MSGTALTGSHVASLKNTARSHWIAKDGLMSLKYNYFKPAYHEGGVNTCDNDNGILYLVEYYWLCKSQNYIGGTDHIQFVHCLNRLADVDGIYNRNPGRTERHQSHDDYVAIVAGSVLFGTDHAMQIISAGMKTGFTFDNQNPGTFNIKRWRQGADIAFYKMATTNAPTMWNFIWFVGKILHNTTQFGALARGKHISEPLLNWLRLKSIELVEKRDGKIIRARKFMFMYKILGYARDFWIWRLKRATNGKGIELVFKRYFLQEGHPNAHLSSGIVY